MTTPLAIAPVQISISSTDPELKTLLREVLAEIGDPQCALTVVRPGEAFRTADVCLWDYEPGTSLPKKSGFGFSKHLFFVNSRDLGEFRATFGNADANILSKPVAREALRSTLGLAASAHRDRLLTASSLREQRDDLLQSLIQTSLHVQDHDQERASFLGRAAHDFYGPATAINGYCSLLLGEHPGTLNETQKQVLQRMQVTARRLSRMASSMLALSSWREAQPAANLAENDIRDCLEQALQEIMALADEKRIAIATDLHPSDFVLYFNRGQIEQVLINILGNASKFTPRGGVISVFGYPSSWESTSRAVRAGVSGKEGLPADANCYRIDIQDSGVPIPNEHLQKIFEEYTSSDGSRDRSDGGLGLAVTRIIMAQHDGHIWIENTAKGPRFSLVLPRRDKAKSNSQ